MQQYAVSLFLCKSTLHVSGGTHAHHQDTGLTVSTVIGTIIGQAQIVSGTASQCSLVRTCTPDDGRVYRPKHVEWTCREINSLHIVAAVGHSIELSISFLI